MANLRDFSGRLDQSRLGALSRFVPETEEQEGRIELWSDPVNPELLPQGYIACDKDEDGRCCVGLDLAWYSDHWEVIGLSYGQPRRSRGGWMGGCMPLDALRLSVDLVIATLTRKAQSSGALFPEST